MTGKPDESKAKAVITHTLREIQRTANADAVLYTRVQPTSARFFNGIAKWDGASESVTGGGSTSALARFLLAGSGTSGTVSALSLVAILDDINSVMMYANGGGIQLTARFFGNSFTPVPRNELFSTDEHYTKPVNLALDPLAKTEQASPAGPVKSKAQ